MVFEPMVFVGVPLMVPPFGSSYTVPLMVKSPYVIVAVPVLADCFPALSMATKLITLLPVPLKFGSMAMVHVGLPDASVGMSNEVNVVTSAGTAAR